MKRPIKKLLKLKLSTKIFILLETNIPIVLKRDELNVLIKLVDKLKQEAR